MWRTAPGSTARLIQLCLGYFLTYVVTGVCVKYFLGSADQGFPGMSGTEYLVYSTAGGSLFALAVVLALGWTRLDSVRPARVFGMRVPSEVLYIVPSGVCTAVVIPTTTLMYTLPISVMVAMVIMRGSVIVISRLVDAIQIRQKLLTKRVYPEENWAVLFAVAAVAANLRAAKDGSFDFLRSEAAMTILVAYIVAYAIRIYIMNYYKNTRPKGPALDNRPFFGIEQIAACITLVIAAIVVFNAPAWFGWSGRVLDEFRGSISRPIPMWGWATLSGTVFGTVAFFSVFLFMFQGRTATFAGLVNRLTSLVAGTAATIVFALGFGGKMPSRDDWISLGLILVAIAFLSMSERKRVRELRSALPSAPS